MPTNMQQEKQFKAWFREMVDWAFLARSNSEPKYKAGDVATLEAVCEGDPELGIVLGSFWLSFEHSLIPGDSPGWWYVVLTEQGRLEFHEDQLQLRESIEY